MVDPTLGSNPEADSGINRRSYIKLLTAAGVAGTAGAVAGSSSADDSAINLGEEGLKNGDQIDPYLDSYFVSGNDVRIPSGQYEWDGNDIGEISDASLVGEGTVELHRPKYETKTRIQATGGEVVVENIAIRGRVGGDSMIRPSAQSEDAHLLFENVRLPDGGFDRTKATGIYVPATHTGTVTFRNCHVEGFADNGLYASSPGSHPNYDVGDGPVIVEGGLYRNNNIASVRLGSSGSVARNVTVVNDAESPAVANGGHAQRGIRIRGPGDDIEVVDCNIIQTYTGSGIPIRIHDGATDGTGVIHDTRIHNDASAAAIGTAPGYDGNGWSGENVHISGEGNLAYHIPVDPVCVDDCHTPYHGRNDDDSHLVAFITEDGASRTAYEFTVDGYVVPIEAPYQSPSGNYVRSTSNYDISAQSDGYAVEGHSGNGYGDAYIVYGEIDDAKLDDSEQMWIDLDGEEVSIEELITVTAGDDVEDRDGDTGEDEESNENTDDEDEQAEELSKSIIVDGSRSETVSMYMFTVTGDIEESNELTTVEGAGLPWDSMATSVTNGKVVGVVGTGIDGFRYSGTLTSAKVRGRAVIQLDTE